MDSPILFKSDFPVNTPLRASMKSSAFSAHAPHPSALLRKSARSTITFPCWASSSTSGVSNTQPMTVPGRWPSHQSRRSVCGASPLCPVHRGFITMSGRKRKVPIVYKHSLQGCGLGRHLVPGGGLEPPRPCGLRILSPLRLPVSPSGLGEGRCTSW